MNVCLYVYACNLLHTMLHYDYEQATLFTFLRRSDWSVETAERSQSKVHKVDSTVLMILLLISRS